MSKQPEDIKFPIQGTDECPHCKSKDKALLPYFEQLEHQGKVPKGSLEGGVTITVPILAALKGPLNLTNEIPVLTVCIEGCAKCKSLYFTKILLSSQKLPPAFMQHASGRGN
ncbi:MAG: hypothetical protein V2A77_01055 [Pseudomonadota bacterium]